MSTGSSKYGDLIRQARKPDNQKTIKPDNKAKSDFLETLSEVKPEREVNLCVKVPESLRRHWAAESKRQGVTMTAVIVEALMTKFGEPS